MPTPHILAQHWIRSGSCLTQSQTLGPAEPVTRSLVNAAVRVPLMVMPRALVSAAVRVPMRAVARAPALAGHSSSGPEGYWALPG
jgi:hypothetical protein